MRWLPAFLLTASLCVLLLLPVTSHAATIIYNNDSPDGKIATASTPAGNGFIERETADDFITTSPQVVTSATFTGLIPLGAALADIQQVVVDIYRVFPKDSTDPPSGHVPTRVNSPSDVIFASRDSAASELNINVTVLSSSFTASNSVVNVINPSPNQTTGGEGQFTGQEIRFDVTFTPSISLPADHYFFVPQVLLNTTRPFLWLSAPRPIDALSGGTPITPDLQSWIRDTKLAPDWLRIGTDIVGGTPSPTYNAAFSISGDSPAVPEPATLSIFACGGIALIGWRCRRPVLKRQRPAGPLSG